MSRFIFSKATSPQISVSDNILFYKFSGKLTKRILFESIQKWFVTAKSKKVKSVYADFSEAVMEVESKNFLMNQMQGNTQIEEIIFYSPIELFSRILLKDFVMENELFFKLKQLKTRFINAEGSEGVWKYRKDFTFSG